MRLPTPLPEKRLPISILTGFLGSGKTTLLSRMLASPRFSDTAVVINEFGQIGLDHLLVEAANTEIVELPNGCLCCTVRQDLADTLYNLLRRRASHDLPAFERIVVETSGLAEPAPILFTLSADAFLENALELDTVLTVIDSIAGIATLDEFAEATAQAALADRIVFTKTDLALPPAALRHRLVALNPAATIGASNDFDPGEILFGGPRALPRRRHYAAIADHTHGIRPCVVLLRKPMSRLEFAMALGGLARDFGEDLLRVKGIVLFADQAEGPAAIHAVRHTIYPPSWLADWPDEDHHSRLVFIVRNISDEDILSRFAAGSPSLAGALERAGES